MRRTKAPTRRRRRGGGKAELMKAAGMRPKTRARLKEATMVMEIAVVIVALSGKKQRKEISVRKKEVWGRSRRPLFHLERCRNRNTVSVGRDFGYSKAPATICAYQFFQ